MGVEENWASFVAMTKSKADSHAKVAQYWDSVHNVLSLSLIVLSACTTLSTLLPIHVYVPATLGAITTLVSAITGSLAPSAKRQQQLESSKGFRSLMLKMVRVETDRNYEELWGEYNKELIGEPFLPSKYKVKADTHFTMSPEFMLVVKKKNVEIKERMEDLDHELKVKEQELGIDEEAAAELVKDVEAVPAHDEEDHSTENNHAESRIDVEEEPEEGEDVRERLLSSS